MTKRNFILLFIGFFLFRLFFGLFRSQIWEIDQIQTYLIGLKFYTTGAWPFFGPDVNGLENESFRSQMPGALEGLMIGLPFFILPIPEAPFILLNLLSMIGVALLAWYIVKRLPSMSYAWLFIWISITSWSIHESTVIINPAFTFLPAVIFFIGFMEATPFLTLKLIPLSLANAAMGLSLFWIMQFHFSYVYLIPLAAFSLIYQIWKTRKPGCLFFFLLGSLPTFALLVPTYLKFGLARNDVASGFLASFNMENAKELTTILARFLSLVCFELPRFIGISTQTRLAFLTDHTYLSAAGAFLWVAGLIQPFVLLFGWFKKESPGPQWSQLKWLVLFVFIMVYASFWFTIKLPLTHIYFVFFPLLMIYSCYCWIRFKDKRYWRLLAQIFLLIGVYFQLAFAVAVAPSDSLYNKRHVIQQAIQEKNYHLFGERREGSLY